MIFPKCMIGRAPQITYTGHVLPCCWIPYEKQLEFTDRSMKDNPFWRDDFNLYNNKLKDIIESQEWRDMLEKIYTDTPLKCKEKCSQFTVDSKGKAETRNAVVPKINPAITNKQEYIETLSSDEETFIQTKEKFTTYKKFQLETTSRCSLQCPYCQRTIEAGTGKYNKSDLSLEVLEDVFGTPGIERIDDCGRYGDPTFYKQYHELLDIIVDSPVERYNMSVAATGRGGEWWNTTIDKLLKIKNSGTKPIITFGIDGLKETSSMHRIGQNFDEIWNAMTGCHEAGIKVLWQVIPTSANEHQLDEMQELADKLGIEIRMVLSNRFKSLNDPLTPRNPDLHYIK
jgi:hypothetical protein